MKEENVLFNDTLNTLQTCTYVFQSHKMKTEISSTERGLLGFLLAKIHKVDPDLLLVTIYINVSFYIVKIRKDTQSRP